MKKSIVGVLLLVLLPVSVSQAQVVVRSGDKVSVTEDEKVAGNFYSLTNILSLSGAIEGDLVAAAGQATVNGSVSEDVLIIGGSVDIHGEVGDDVRVIGGEVVIAEPVAGNIFVVGGTVNILSTATVGGDVLVYGGEVAIAGSVTGSVLGRANTLRIDGPVGKDIDVAVDSLVLGDRANVSGRVVYVSNELLVRSQNAVVAGEVLRNDVVREEAELRPTMVVIPFLMFLFSILVWFLIGRSLLQMVADRAAIRSPRPVLLGLIGVFFVPVALVILLVSVLGTLVGIIALCAYILAVLLSFVATGAVAGVWLQKAFGQPVQTLSLATVLLGTFFIAVCSLLPIIGPVIILALFVLTLGSLLDIVLRPRVIQ